MLKYTLSSLVIMLGATLFACSSGNGASSANACFAAEKGEACAACAEASCGSQLHDAESACAAYLDCLCPGGTFDATTASTCTSTITPACNDANTPLGVCMMQQCQSACSSTGSSSSSSSSSGGSNTVPFSCTTGDSCSFQLVTPSLATTVTENCMGAGGTVGTGCAATGLVGCCKYGTSENCFYTTSSAAGAESTCSTTGGVWSTTL